MGHWRGSLLIWAASLGVLVTAGTLRIPQLTSRPMHCDEANQAYRTGVLLETGEYRYDPHEHHGPTLYYAGLVSAWLRGEHRFEETTETTYRIVPVVFGLGVVVLTMLMFGAIGRTGATAAALLTAVSPACVYYSRYYIQETMLVFFTALVLYCGYRYRRSPHAGWALGTGLSLGLMYATKETCVLAFAAMAGGIVLSGLWGRRLGIRPASARPRIRWRDAFIALSAIALVAVVFYTSFLTYPRGLLDSVLAFSNFEAKSQVAGPHDKPWYYYLAMLAYSRTGRGPVWSEGAVLALAVIGSVVALRRKDTTAAASFQRFLVFYTFLLTAAYSAIPYKTPWCVLSFLHGMILLAGVGLASVLYRWRKRPIQAITAAAFAAACCHLVWESHRGNGVYAARPENPYAYVHTSPSLLRLVERVEDIEKVSPDGFATVIKVMQPDLDYWPLPWYFRHFERVGYWTSIPEGPDAPMIIVTPELIDDLGARLREKYQVEFYGLRPGVLLALYIREDLWEVFLQSRSSG